MTKISRALLAPYDKVGIEELGAALHKMGVEILATSGTAKRLKAARIPAMEVSEYTGFPEILGGRVKTLHPKIHGGILARRDDPEHRAQMDAHGIQPIDLVCLNLYPFVETIQRPGVTLEEAVEQIDIGGPTMLRAAAKNHAHVLAIIDPGDYDDLLQRIAEDRLDDEYRRHLAAKAFRHTAVYDTAITRFLGADRGTESEEDYPHTLQILAERVRTLRYGENPHQSAALYSIPGEGGLPVAEVLNGKPLSFNNLQDAAGAYGTVGEFAGPGAVVVKHANPCGAACADDLKTAFRRAWEGDPISAFGGILAFNRPVTPDLAEAIAEPGRFVEVIIAPSFLGKALRILAEKPKWGRNVRILACAPGRVARREIRSLPGGFLLQDRDRQSTELADLKVVTKRAPTDAEARDLVFAQKVCKHVKSNAIVLVKEQQVVGVGAGQMSRVDSARMAVQKAGDRAKGSVFASAAFLPFNDALEVALDAGAAAAIQPGGSRNDAKCV
ncbi:MAG: bifunctional phosphoribosylaminoimidazolecarboxamide formyltransferase/IMP cyclohydrolase, partial [Planctomycetota bacterium]|nr:bifunctional phosphoribosylaminoimidazolecarboxamide formyltransferase/IMP cyclohydrolase [Planctomycetota bacterium]